MMMPNDTTLMLTDGERHNLEAFLEDHGHCTDSTLTFEVTGSHIGPTTEVICQCGKKKNITDYSAW
jgi:hypothetical protein